MKRIFALCALVALTACGAPSVYAPDEKLGQVRYSEPDRAYVTLLTILNVGSDRGAHTALLVNGSERVLFDPAGSFVSDTAPERNDVLFGINPAELDFFIDYHTRREFYTVAQTIDVDLAVANDLIARMQTVGPVAQALCARSTSALLRETSGFETLSGFWFPEKLMAQFGALPNSRAATFRDYDAEKESAVRYAWRGQPSRFKLP